jgi:hypothetical protein
MSDGVDAEVRELVSLITIRCRIITCGARLRERCISSCVCPLHVPHYLLRRHGAISDSEITFFAFHLLSFPFDSDDGLHLSGLDIFLKTPTFDLCLVLFFPIYHVNTVCYMIRSRHTYVARKPYSLSITSITSESFLSSSE